uniref:Uncharacterized protein n=1 Tax=Burkholderia cenocepacia TaxID=95486 RepID=A0A071M4R5_9BURK
MSNITKSIFNVAPPFLYALEYLIYQFIIICAMNMCACVVGAIRSSSYSSRVSRHLDLSIASTPQTSTVRRGVDINIIPLQNFA